MSLSNLARIRNAWWSLHRWIGIGLAILLLPISVSGALLVWHDQLDALLNPSRYAITGAQLAQSPSAYLASAAAALSNRAQPVAVRFPAEQGWPVIVSARSAPRGEGARPSIFNVYLDPPTGRVLDVVDFRTSLFGWLHRFHENLTIPEYSGRAIVGWVGVGMLILSLTGIWLWWPRTAFLRGLRWRRAAHTTTNLHHLLGFWISLPLAVVSATGIYLGFPQNARMLMSSIAPMTPPGPRPGSPVRDTQLTPDSALAAALAAQPGARPVVLFLPSSAGGGGGRGEQANPGERLPPLWRVQLRTSEASAVNTIMVNDRTAAVERLPDPLAGDSAARWIRGIHEGSRGGPLWQVAVFLTGVFPVIFVVTGIVMWLRGRRGRKAAVIAEAKLQAAE